VLAGKEMSYCLPSTIAARRDLERSMADETVTRPEERWAAGNVVLCAQSWRKSSSRWKAVAESGKLE
jgi:hypothetical protein